MASFEDPVALHSPVRLAATRRYLGRYFGRHFDAVRILNARPAPADPPRIAYANHPAWWDPLALLLVATTRWPGVRPFAPIDGRALERYSILKRLGLFPAASGSFGAARQFLRAADSILAAPDTLLALTPHGRFADPRERGLRFRPGLSRLLLSAGSREAVPVALEYAFWSERLPEALIAFGEPVRARTGETAAGLNARLEASLESLQDELAAAAVARNEAAFTTLLPGRRQGAGVAYDAFEGLRALVSGRRFSRQHRHL